MRNTVVSDVGPGTFRSGYNISVIGSFRRHYDDVVEVVGDFVASGFKVTSPPVSVIVNPGAEYVRFEMDPVDALDHEIQAVTLRKILESDLVYVVAPGGYIGRTTSYELGCIHQKKIPVYYSQRPNDMPIEIPETDIIAAAELVRDPRILRLLAEGAAGVP